MSVRIVAADAYRRVRWKNGLGWTSEIAQGRLCAPAPDGEDASLMADGEWDWRLSIAEIDTDAPFSSFSGMDRTLVLIEGAGLRLEFDDGGCIALDAWMPRADFAGERGVIGRLPTSPVRVLNLMTRRGRLESHVETIAVRPDAPVIRGSEYVTAILAMSGNLSVHAGGATEILRASDTALIQSGPGGDVTTTGEGTAILVRLHACA